MAIKDHDVALRGQERNAPAMSNDSENVQEIPLQIMGNGGAESSPGKMQNDVQNIMNKAETFDDMSSARIGLILFRYGFTAIGFVFSYSEGLAEQSWTVYLFVCTR